MTWWPGAVLGLSLVVRRLEERLWQLWPEAAPAD